MFLLLVLSLCHFYFISLQILSGLNWTPTYLLCNALTRLSHFSLTISMAFSSFFFFLRKLGWCTDLMFVKKSWMRSKPCSLFFRFYKRYYSEPPSIPVQSPLIITAMLFWNIRKPIWSIMFCSLNLTAGFFPTFPLMYGFRATYMHVWYIALLRLISLALNTFSEWCRSHPGCKLFALWSHQAFYGCIQMLPCVWVYMVFEVLAC